MVPLSFDDDVFTLAIDETQYDQSLQGELELITGYNVQLKKEKKEVVYQQLSKLYRKDAEEDCSH